MGLLNIDQLGLDKTDRRMLETIIYKFNGGPVGLETLAATINEESRSNVGKMFVADSASCFI